MKSFTASAVALAATTILGVTAVGAQSDWHRTVEQSLGHGDEKKNLVFEVEMPRSDLKIERAGVALSPGLDFTDEFRFMPMPSGVMFMGEVVLTTDEMNPVISRLEARGFSVAAIHRHILNLSPELVWVHFSAAGDPGQLAQSLRYALAASKTPLPAQASGSPKKTPDVDTAKIDQILGAKGKSKEGLFTFSIPVDMNVEMDGVTLPADMGLSIGLKFQPTGGGRAVATGEFPLGSDAVGPVMRALQSHGLQVQALHNHMLTEHPRVFYLHFWGADDAVRIAQGLRAAVDLASPRPGG